MVTTLLPFPLGGSDEQEFPTTYLPYLKVNYRQTVVSGVCVFASRATGSGLPGRFHDRPHFGALRVY